MDFIALVAALLVFAYFHHVKPRADVAVGLTSNREAAGAAAAVETESAQTTDVMQQNLQAVIAQIQADTQPGAEASNDAVGNRNNQCTRSQRQGLSDIIYVRDM